jgi:hypothetical protein
VSSSLDSSCIDSQKTQKRSVRCNRFHLDIPSTIYSSAWSITTWTVTLRRPRLPDGGWRRRIYFSSECIRTARMSPKMFISTHCLPFRACPWPSQAGYRPLSMRLCRYQRPHHWPSACRSFGSLRRCQYHNGVDSVFRWPGIPGWAVPATESGSEISVTQRSHYVCHNRVVPPADFKLSVAFSTTPFWLSGLTEEVTLSPVDWRRASDMIAIGTC